MFFAKPEYREIMMPFKFDDSPDDFTCGGISIEVFGDVFGEEKYCYASYILQDTKMYDNGEYEKGKTKDFKVDLDSLAKACGDDRFRTLELVGWGMNDKGSCME